MLRGGQPIRRRRAGVLAAAVSIAASLGSVIPAGAQAAPPATVAAAAGAEPPGFVPGEAQAGADTVLVGISPGGGKPITFGLGASLARFQNRTASAQGSALSLGLLEVFLGPSSQCGALQPIIPADQLPPVTSNDSRRNAPMAQPVEVRSPGDDNGPGGLLGTQIANATADPQSSTAATTTVTQEYGVLGLDGGRTEVTTSLVGGVREARAVVTGEQLRVLGGMVTIRAPRWEAVARSGGTTTTEGSFTFAGASLFGVERTAAQFGGDFAGFAAGVANLLSGFGVHLDYPKVVVTDGAVEVTPLRLGLKNPPVGLSFVQPLLKFLQPFKDQATRDAITANCNNQAVLQIVDLMLGVLSGTGEMTLGVGGARAMTAATVFPEPAPLDLPALDAPATPTPTVAPLVAGTNSFRSSSFSTSSDSSYEVPVSDMALPAVEAPPLAAEPVAATSPATTAPQFELPSATMAATRYEPGERGGPALVVGILGLLVVGALAAGDRFVMRRSRREIPDT